VSCALARVCGPHSMKLHTMHSKSRYSSFMYTVTYSGKVIFYGICVERGKGPGMVCLHARGGGGSLL
jgi:hypothetical protein